MCRAPVNEAAPAQAAKEKEPLAEVVVDPLVTDLRHFHPSGAAFPALPRGEFTVVRRIAPGIHGDVFKCHRACGGEHEVAVKKLRLQSVRPLADAEYNERRAHLRLGGRVSPYQEDALTEIGVLQYLARQVDLPRHILQMHGIFQDQSHAWLVTEFAEGGELFDEVAQQGPLPRARAKRYFSELMEGIAYLHRHRIGHRDISLENVLIKEGSVRLMDFGMAVRSEAACGTRLRYFRCAGKDFYRAPECYVPLADTVDVVVPADAEPGSVVFAKVCGAYPCEVLLPADAKANCRARAKVYGYEAPPADIFAAGVCLFIMLAGNPPWSKATPSDACFAWVLEHDVAELMTTWGLPVVAPDLAEVLKSLTAADPSRRWSAKSCLSCSWLLDLKMPTQGGA